VSATVSPTLGVLDLTTFTTRLEAQDPDGDPLSITWSSRGRGVVGTAANLAFKAGEVWSPLTVTVTDPRGASSTAEVAFIIGDLWGAHDGYFSENTYGRRGYDYSMYLTRTGTTVTGTIKEFGVGARSGAVSPDEPGRIDEEGRFSLPFTIGSLSGFTFVGRLVPLPGVTFPTNYGAEGVITGGQLSGRPFFFSEHDPFLRISSPRLAPRSNGPRLLDPPNLGVTSNWQ
jgi:hypothetical protein